MTLSEVFGILTSRPTVFCGAIDKSGYHLLNLQMTRVLDTLAAFCIVDRLAAYIVWITGCTPQELSSVFLLYVLGGKTAVYDLDILDQILPD